MQKSAAEIKKGAHPTPRTDGSRDDGSCKRFFFWETVCPPCRTPLAGGRTNSRPIGLRRTERLPRSRPVVRSEWLPRRVRRQRPRRLWRTLLSGIAAAEADAGPAHRRIRRSVVCVCVCASFKRARCLDLVATCRHFYLPAQSTRRRSDASKGKPSTTVLRVCDSECATGGPALHCAAGCVRLDKAILGRARNTHNR